MARHGDRIDCKKPELDDVVYQRTGRTVCRWCGRVCKWTRSGKLQHRRGYHRVHPDPRKE